MTEFQRRPQRIEAMRVTPASRAAAARLAGGHLDDDGTLVLPLYGEGSAVPIDDGSWVWQDESGPQVCDDERFAAEWAEISDGPTLRERIEKLEALVDGGLLGRAS